MIYPEPLQKGDHIAIICPSTPTSREKVDRAKVAFEALGFVPVMYPSCYAYHGHLAGNDALRLKDLHDAFASPQIKGIVCLKGGAGATRLLAKIDFELIKRNPKVFIGYSDITALLISIQQQCDFMTFHGPMATSEIFIDPSHHDDHYSRNSFLSNLTTVGGYHGQISNPEGEELISLYDGTCEGLLTGGNLSLLAGTLGTPYEVDTKGKILFIEEIGEEMYKVDKMLTSLALAGKLEECVGVVFGTFTDCLQEEKPAYSGKDLDLMTIIEEVVMPFQKPILFNLRAGHNFPQPTLPIGGYLFMNTYEKKLILL
jgi:muramoyltetrapeptide carboxypeptidase